MEAGNFRNFFKMKFVLSMALLCASTPVFAGDCSVDHFNFIYGIETSTHMVVKSGGACRVGLSGHTAVDSSRIEQNGSNGVVTAVDEKHWSYKPRKGFSGKDAFIVMVSGTSTRRARVYQGDTKINVDVDVTP